MGAMMDFQTAGANGTSEGSVDMRLQCKANQPNPQMVSQKRMSVLPKHQQPVW
jgi:hypothetical protein